MEAILSCHPAVSTEWLAGWQIAIYYDVCARPPLAFHRHSRWLYIYQQSSSSSSNRFIEHDVSTRKLGPSSGIRPIFLNRPIFAFMLLCLGVATHRPKLFWKNAELFLETSTCLCGFAVKLCWNRVWCYVHVPAEVGFYVQFLVKFATSPQSYWTKSNQILLRCNPWSWLDVNFDWIWLIGF